jgi:pimeloyl-ACP methyl ester carboxylesterase
MREGTVSAWLVDEGAEIGVGTPIIDVETDKISNAVEAPDPGLLRRKVAQAGETLPVKALLGVLADASVSNAEIDAFVAGYVVPAAEADDEDAGPAYDFAEVDGLRVRYARRGASDGVPVLFIHGFGGDLDNWLFNLDALAVAAPVIALDLPGHGQSTPRLPGTALADLAAFVVHFLDRLEVDRVHLVGHSLGGAIAVRIALDQPARAGVARARQPGRVRRRDQRRLHRRLCRRGVAPRVETGGRATLRRSRTREPAAARRPAQVQAPGRRERGAARARRGAVRRRPAGRAARARAGRRRCAAARCVGAARTGSSRRHTRPTRRPGPRSKCSTGSATWR